MASPEQIMTLRYELGDVSTEFPILTDQEYSYFIDKNNGSLRRSMLDSAKTILFKLSLRGEEVVDIFSIKGNKVAQEYRDTLKMLIKNPDFNPALNLAAIFAGGVSVSDIQSNYEDTDANAVTTPLSPKLPLPTNYFEI
jgi:hypothetical protein